MIPPTRRLVHGIVPALPGIVACVASNRDHATDNRVTGNSLLWHGARRDRPALETMIRLTASPGNTRNVARDNRWLSTSPRRRPIER